MTHFIPEYLLTHKDPTLYFDMDGILVDLLGAWLRKYNKELSHGNPVVPAQITDWSMSKSIGCGPEVYDLLREEELWDGLLPVDGALQYFSGIRNKYKVKILTAPFTPYSAKAKLDWCKKYLRIKPTDVIMCHDKWELAGPGRILFDDKAQNCLEWEDNLGCAATIAYPYNEDAHYLAVGSYLNTKAAWRNLSYHLGIPDLHMDFIQEFPCLYTNVRCGFYLPEKWATIVHKLSSEILVTLQRSNLPLSCVKVEQVKSKFGGLRFYYKMDSSVPGSTVQDVGALVRKAELAASKVP